MAEIADDVSNWNADMEAWRLTPKQRVHHLRRLHAYHQSLLGRYVAAYERTYRIERRFALAAVIALIMFVVQWVGDRQ